jgi:hypothetical protein
MRWRHERVEMKFFVLSVFLASVLVGVGSPSAAQAQDQSQPQTNQAQPDQQPAPAQPSTAPATAPAEQDQSPGEGQTAAPQPAPTDTDHPVLKRRPAKKTAHNKPAAKAGSGKVIVQNGGAKEGTPELSPGISKEQERHKRENTDQLLATTDTNLKSVAGRQLTPAQQGMVEQIHTYVAQSKTASDAGDLDRAHTLAFKAHLLSDELAKK